MGDPLADVPTGMGYDGGVPTRVYLEIGKTKAFACTVEWPGWCRSGKGEQAALDALVDYAERYRPVVEAAGVRWPTNATRFEVTERLPGSGATDFGALSKPCLLDARALSAADSRRLAAIVEASWATLDRVAGSASPVLRKGPRGGGRDRDEIVAHVVDAERSYFRKVGIRTGDRSEFIDALRRARNPVPVDTPGKAWPWRYIARRVAWHVLDHAWEIEDKSE